MSFYVQYQGTPKRTDYAHVFVDADEVTSTWVSQAKNKTKLFGYCSVGTWENWRKDAKEFPSASLGSNVDGWKGEKWLKNNSKLPNIYKARLDRLKRLGFKGVDFDNVEICEREPAIKSTVKEIISYAQSLGLLISLRSYHSGKTPYCYLAEQVKSQGTFNKYKPKALLFNLEYEKVSKDSRFQTAITNLALDGKKWIVVK
jgi:hypothetical protein